MAVASTNSNTIAVNKKYKKKTNEVQFKTIFASIQSKVGLNPIDFYWFHFIWPLSNGQDIDLESRLDVTRL